ncbi:DUF4097 family beta strand repeat-containing protein [Paenibacillus sp. GCM10027626]|uniref:DUF4097 family beta strand repeat-containing protein n=1 Tax=Paenibacillus sp. GCM10027626 TaxID=3273411 RepID=UPI00362F757C
MRNWLIVAAILIVIGLIGAGVTLGQDGFSLKTVDVLKEESVPAAGIKKVRLETGSTDVTVVRGDGDQIKAELKGKASGKFIDRIKLEVETTGDVLTIKSRQDTGFSIGINILDVELKVELPEQQYEELALDAGSGNAKISGWSGEKLNIDISSGNVTAEQIKGTAELATGSGNITVHELEGEEVVLKTSSGNIRLDQAKINKGTVTTGSGEVQLNDVDGPMTVGTSSGGIDIGMERLLHPLNLKTGSGDVSIETDEEPQSAAIEFDTGSGDLSSDWDNGFSKTGRKGGELKFGNGEIKVSVDTGSGSLSVGKR